MPCSSLTYGTHTHTLWWLWIVSNCIWGPVDTLTFVHNLALHGASWCGKLAKLPLLGAHANSERIEEKRVWERGMRWKCPEAIEWLIRGCVVERWRGRHGKREILFRSPKLVSIKINDEKQYLIYLHLHTFDIYCSNLMSIYKLFPL